MRGCRYACLIYSLVTLLFALVDVPNRCPVSVVRRLCDKVKSEASGHDDKDPLQQLKDFWLVANADRLSDGGLVADMDERFHLTLVVAAGNPEMARVHLEVIERIRIIRRLDFTRADRVEETYNEHAQILRATLERRAD